MGRIKMSDGITAEKILKDSIFRKELAKKSHYWFFHIYFRRYVTYETADFHRKLFAITENEKLKNAVITAFRGSGKSTVMTLSYVVWSILGLQQKKYIVLIGQTQQQSRRIIENIRREFEANDLLVSDFGPFIEQNYEWSLNSLSIPQFGARIDGYSSGESIRGIRHGEFRPQVIIADDVEDLQSVRTKENRDKTYDWFTGDILGLGDKETKTILIGNHLHLDSLIERRKKDIIGKENTEILRIPLLEDDGKCNWLGKYPTKKDIESEHKRVGNEIAWQREFLLNTVSDFDQVVFPEWIHHYDGLPEKEKWSQVAVGVDVAISSKESSDKTAMVTLVGCHIEDELYIYVLPNPVNKHLDFPETVNQIRSLRNINGQESMFYVESVAYQQSLVQTLEHEAIAVEGVKVTVDKRSRLAVISTWIKEGRILFPKEGCEDLIDQILNLGIERYDDLVDAFTLGINKMIENLSSTFDFIIF
jgi:predicted phage terminase large subunit-like protein